MDPSPYGSPVYRLSWFKPICGSCEKMGKYCRLRSRNNSSSRKHNETKCSHSNIPNPNPPSTITDAPPPSKQATGETKSQVLKGVIPSGLFFLLVVMVTVYLVHISNKSKKEDQIKIERFLEDYRALKPTRYTYVEIKKIIDNFKEKLGQGGYGTVYKGKFSNDVHIAAKILNDVKGTGDDFINEVGTIGRIHHINVVCLVGYCADGFKRALVYECFPNDSLEKFISSNQEKCSLGWERLQGIALGIAKEQSDVSMTDPRGTIGYIAPEVFSRNFGNASYKSDVYRFGMLLLEMGIMVEEDGDAKIVKKITIVGLWCIQWYPGDRPLMKVVVQMLEGDGDTLAMPPNPFTTTNPRTTTGGKSFDSKLEVISEFE
ncbi:hypothetical protein ACSBR2_027196 [Camellia fascicularis]